MKIVGVGERIARSEQLHEALAPLAGKLRQRVRESRMEEIRAFLESCLEETR